MFDLLVAGQQLFEIEGRAYRTDTLARTARARHVVEQVVEKVIDRVVVVREQTFVNNVLELPVGLPQQALDGDRRFEPTVLQ